MIETRIIETAVHGRYLLRPSPGGRLLVGFHGYGETADAQMERLESIPGADAWTLVSVQALHPFYTRGGDVVASWMTKLDREEAIADNISWVRRVVEDLGDFRPIVYAGFSQGVAMAFRAATHLAGDGVIALGSDIPPEVVESATRVPPVLLGRGTKDEWFPEEKFKENLSFLRNVTEFETCVFAGGHEWSGEFSRAAGEFLRKLSGTPVDSPARG